jgi:hypothetical protein
MKVRMKHKETEIEVEDPNQGSSYELIYHNQTYLLKLLETMAEQVVKVNKDEFLNKP